MKHSEKCDKSKRWDRSELKCVPCAFWPGREITPNCGYDDDGGRHDGPYRPCPNNTFNDGSWAYCQNCTSCRSGYITVSNCTPTTDTQCRDSGVRTTEVTARETETQEASLTPFLNNSTASPHLLWAVPLIILISIMLAVLCACGIYMKRKRGMRTVLSYNRRSSYINAGFSSLASPPGNNDLDDILSPTILSAPLQTVLDNLDVLEELVILLDPETHGIKNTKHLASHCSFSSTWITYAYSMKDSKSPLKAVLEGVNSRHPEWTVGHLCKMLKLIERNDAIIVLAKLRANEMDV